MAAGQGASRRRRLSSSGSTKASEARWGIYLRISQDRTGEGAGVERQRQDCEAYIERYGGLLVQVYDDNNKSGYKGERAEYTKLKTDLIDGKIDHVIVWHLDRVGRDLVGNTDFARLIRATGAVLHDCRGPRDLSTAAGKLHFNVESVMAQAQSDFNREKIIRAMEDLRAQGRATGGRAPYGWRGTYCGAEDCDKEHRPYHIVEDEAEVIRWATQELLKRDPKIKLNSLVRDLNARKVPAPAVGRRKDAAELWTRKALRLLLLRARNAGWVETKDKVNEFGIIERAGELKRKAKDWEPILEDDEWEAVKNLLTEPHRFKHFTGNKPVNLLSNIAMCGECGDYMITGVANTKHSRKDGTEVRNSAKIYKCKLEQASIKRHAAGKDGESAPFKGHPARRKDPIDLYVTEYLLARIEAADPSDLLKDHLDDVQRAIQGEIRGLRQEMEDLALALQERAMTLGQFKINNEPLMARYNELVEVAEPIKDDFVLREFVSRTQTVQQVWDALPVDRRRAVVRALCSGIIIKSQGRGRGFDPASVIIIDSPAQGPA